jgi:hypothetical protein
VQSNIDFCPACGESMDSHPRLLIVPVIVFDVDVGAFIRKWTHSGDPSRN